MSHEIWLDSFSSITSNLDDEFFSCTDDSGVCHVIEFSDIDFKVTHYQNSTGSFVAEEVATLTDQNNFNCCGFLDAAGKLHFVALTNGSPATEVYYMTNASGSWVSTLIHSQAVAETFSGPLVTADASSKAHVIFTEDASTIEYMTNASGSWVGPTTICNVGTGAGEMIATDPRLTGFAVNSNSTDLMITGRGATTNLESLRYSSGSWGSTVQVSSAYRSATGNSSPCINTGSNTYQVFFGDSSVDLVESTYSSGSWAAATDINISFSNPLGLHRGAAARIDTSGRVWITALASEAELLYSDDGSTWYRFPTNDTSPSLNYMITGSSTNNGYICDIVKYASSTIQHSPGAIPGVDKGTAVRESTAASHTVGRTIYGAGSAGPIQVVIAWATGAASINDLSITASAKMELIAGTAYTNADNSEYVLIEIWRHTESAGFAEITMTITDSGTNATAVGIACAQYVPYFNETFLLKEQDSANATTAASSGNVTTTQNVTNQFNLLIGFYEDGTTTTTFDSTGFTSGWYETDVDAGATESELNAGENRYFFTHNFESGAKTESIDITGAAVKENVIAVLYTLEQGLIPVGASFVPKQIFYG